jgi:hypothetical protein
MIGTQCETPGTCGGSGHACAFGAADWLVAAAPTFAVMALLTGTSSGLIRRALPGGCRCIAAERNGGDVSADERLPFGPG